MKRRKFLNVAGMVPLMAGLPLTAAAVGKSENGGKRIGIVGGGIVGASIAMHLAEMGADVTLMEKSEPGAGATGKSLAWINAQHDHPDYIKLRLSSLFLWRKRDVEMNLGVVWGGYINWAEDEETAKGVRTYGPPLDGTPYANAWIDREEMIRLSPHVVPKDKVLAAYHSWSDGHVDPVRAMNAFLDRARQLGAKIVYPCEVREIRQKSGRVSSVETTKGSFKFDKVVIATGVDAPAILEKFGYTLRLAHKPGVMVRTRPIPVVTKMVYDGPRGIEFKQMADGRVVGQTSRRGPPDLPVHAGIRSGAFDFPNEALRQAHGERTIRDWGEYMPSVRGAGIERIDICYRPYPIDGLPVVGNVPGVDGLYMSVCHSGVTLSQILGTCVAAELLGTARSELLEPFRPERFSA